MIRYIKQKDWFSCSVVALMNAMKWNNQKCSIKTHRKKLIKQTKSRYRKTRKNPYKGALCIDFHQALQKNLKTNWNITRNPDLLINHLTNSNKSAIVLFVSSFKEDGSAKSGHYVFITPESEIEWNIINLGHGEPKIKKINQHGFIQLLKKGNNVNDGYPKIWLLEKNKN